MFTFIFHLSFSSFIFHVHKNDTHDKLTDTDTVSVHVHGICMHTCTCICCYCYCYMLHATCRSLTGTCIMLVSPHHTTRPTRHNHTQQLHMAMPPTNTMHSIVSFCQFTVIAPSDCVSQCETLGTNKHTCKHKDGQ